MKLIRTTKNDNVVKIHLNHFFNEKFQLKL